MIAKRMRRLLIPILCGVTGLVAGILVQRAGWPARARDIIGETVARIQRRQGVPAVFKGVRYPGNPVLSTADGAWDAAVAGWGSVVRDREGYLFYYTGRSGEVDHRIGLALGADGLSWRKSDANPVLLPGPPRSWDERNVWCPIAWKEGGTYHMLYSGADHGDVKRVGHATSADGIRWTKDIANPVFDDPNEWARGRVEGWGLMKVGDTYHLWYSTLGPAAREIGLALSKDLVRWTPVQDSPVFAKGPGHDYSQFCPWPFRRGDAYYLIVSSRDSRNDHRLKLYRSPDPRFRPEDRTFLGFVLETRSDIHWEAGGYLDTPCVLADDLTMTVPLGREVWVYYTPKEKGDRRHTGLFTLDLGAP